MIRGLILTASFLLVGAVPALAQTHSRPHPQGYPHGPGHVRPDSVTHAEMHARLHGNWTGTLSTTQGAASGFAMSISRYGLRKMELTMQGDPSLRFGAGKDFVLTGDSLHWTQVVSGKPCKATARVRPATSVAPETITGEVACDDKALTFSLRRKTV